MGAVPKHRISTGRRGRRRAHIKVEKPRLVECPTCRHLKRPHEVCSFCGKYKTKHKPKK